ncbi:hypothetical protein [Auraticoccus monumenti]|uniref:Uncharacterized protein n=1 Tax=Auraticoccus monumenti TaxID=675864 RepID=A0A1G6UR20_9ACTN|nr:hypothetical protein [Auraticoccus monumenti]SDD43005.1 hypothetical protein SAMN04489747_0931 [Auraticoccus monumenti]
MSIRMTCRDCGHSHSYRTQGLADHHFPRHSCAAQNVRMARRRRRVARERSSGEQRECTHPQAHHEHGTRLAYVLDKCRCRPCRDAVRVYESARSRRIAYGRPGSLVDADPVRAHLKDLSAQGMGWKRAAAAAGVANGTVYAILYGKLLSQPDHPEHRPPRKRVRRDIAEKLLAVQVTLAAGALVDGTGTRRRLQALVAIGWSMSELGRRLGWQPANAWKLVTGEGQVTHHTAAGVRALYDELWNQPVTGSDRATKTSATRASQLAGRNGWLPPLAWDDDLIDDPASTPSCESGTRRDALEDIVWLADQGETLTAIARHLQLAESTVEQRLRRHDRVDLLHRLRPVAA